MNYWFLGATGNHGAPMPDMLGFVGTGKMGEPMANRLLDAGHPLVVYATSATKPLRRLWRGARSETHSSRAVAGAADIIFFRVCPNPQTFVARRLATAA